MGLTVALFSTNLFNKKYAQNSHPTALGLSSASNGGVLTALVREPRIWASRCASRSAPNRRSPICSKGPPACAGGPCCLTRQRSG